VSLERRVVRLLRDVRASNVHEVDGSVRVALRLLEAVERELRDKPHSPPDIAGQALSRPGKQRGPKPDIDKHTKVTSVVADYLPDWGKGARFREVVKALTKARVGPPRKWRMSWAAMMEREPDKVRKTIRNHLDQFK
jgi:hypothetical protein